MPKPILQSATDDGSYIPATSIAPALAPITSAAGTITTDLTGGMGGDYDYTDRFEDDDDPDTKGFYFNNRNIFDEDGTNSFLGMDGDAWMSLGKSAAGALFKPANRTKASGTHNSSGFGNIGAIMGKLHTTKHKKITKVKPDEVKEPDTDGLVFMEAFTGRDFHQSDAVAKVGSKLTPYQANQLMDYRRRILANRKQYSSFTGDPYATDFIGFNADEIDEYADFLGLDKIGKAIGTAAKAVGNAVGTAAKAVGNAVGTGASAVGRAAVFTGKEALQAGKYVGTGVVNAGKYTVRNAGNILETGAGAGLMLLGQPEGATLIAGGLRNMITDANGGEDVIGEALGEVKSPSQIAAENAALLQAQQAAMLGSGAYSVGGSGDYYDASQYDMDPNVINEGDDYDETDAGELGDTSQYTPEQLAAAKAALAAKKKKQKLIRYAIYAAIAVALAVAGYFIWKHYHKHKKK